MKPAIAVCVLLCSFTLARADDWPAWRGPTGQGFCAEKDLPLKWSDKENVKWKVALAEPGNSTPVVWGDKIFLTQANKGGSVRSLLCFARADGKLLWQKDVAYADKERNWNQNWYCNASPATDGERVVVSFGSAGMYCYDFAGKELWKRTDLGKWEHAFGNGASPVLYGDLAILWCGPNERQGPATSSSPSTRRPARRSGNTTKKPRLLEHAAHRQGQRPGPAPPGPSPTMLKERSIDKTG